MKRVLLLGTLLLGLTACGGGGGTVTPDTSYPYNPSASVTQSSDARVPYRGDWVFVAKLADGSQRYGLASITTKYSDNDLKNAGGGFMSWCVQLDCKQYDEQGNGLIGSASISGSVQLVIGMVPKGTKTTRFEMADVDGRVEKEQDHATIKGQGSWVDAAGNAQTAVFAFVQVSTESKLGTQAARAQAMLTAQGLAQGRALGAQRVAPGGEVRAVLERALAK
ncbi:hypothetical protein DAETH_41090 (plasmid) [Deinococcus aetherius]|uniref:Lipoprotein n=1 Tax=Deinococcus aetherius TaxID=200252 RepID=A0ABM8AJY7_9DEIO|nr:hypothetical protein [Deinococcus aetherius]BDP44140.1 hypothetical protein DAETH_41090 [Deinococcus aetherius]